MKESKRPYNDRGQAHGYWEVNVGGELWVKGFFKHGDKVGRWVRNDSNILATMNNKIIYHIE